MTLYLLHYNNYFNRIIKTETALEDYLDYSLGSIQNVNFNPADGVDTEQIINWSGDTPDYVVCVNEQSQIDSRWFVIEASRTRGLQYLLKLKRDVIADNLASFMTSTAFIKRGYVPNTNPLIFNSEGNSFNQIKQGETLLSNNLNTPWIVLYLSRYHTDEQTGDKAYNTFEGEFIDEASSSNTDYELDSLEDYKYYQYSQTPYKYLMDDDIRFHSLVQKMPSGSSRYTITHNDLESDGTYTAYSQTLSSSNYPIWTGNGWTPLSNITTEQAIADFNSLLAIYHTGDTVGADGLPTNTYTNFGAQSGAIDIGSENGKTIKVGNKVYRIVVNTNNEYSTNNEVRINSGTNLGANMVNTLFTKYGVNTNGRTLDLAVEWGYYTYNTEVTFQETQVASNGIRYNIKYDGAVTTDSVYEILATPYKDITFTDGDGVINHSGDIALQWFQDIINRYNGAGQAYDIQIVPYMPSQLDVTNITNLEKVYCYSGTQPNTVNNSVAFKVPSASFSLSYSKTLPTVNSNNKISVETQLYRIVSPNGVGEYEFSPAKNGGFTGFEVDCTLIPFNPYIKVNPIFGWMYGSDFNDYRGLILGGNYSLPILNDQWSTYELQNKNYQAIFDRQIESQDYQRTWERASDIVGAISGSFGGIAGGAIAGSVAGPGGAIAGAVAGGLTSIGGGVTDVIAKEQIYQEQRQASIDTFNMQLGNVKARAQSLTRSTSYNINNKYFPYIEYFTCSDEELEAFNLQIQYRGMSVGVVGVIDDYLNPSSTTYIQGDLIDIDITDDYHMAREIANVLRGGIRIYA